MQKHLFSWGGKENNDTWGVCRKANAVRRGTALFYGPCCLFLVWREMYTFRAALARRAVYLTRCPLGKPASRGIVPVMQYSL